MTASMRLMHEGCGSGHITVGGADDDLLKALTIARHRASGSALEPYTGASRAGMSLKTQNKCGLGQLRLAAGGPGPGERQRRRGGELRAGNSASWHLLSATRSYADSPASQLTTSPSLLLSRPRPIRSKPEVSETTLILGLQAHIDWLVMPRRGLEIVPDRPHPRRLRGHYGGHYRRQRPRYVPSRSPHAPGSWVQS